MYKPNSACSNPSKHNTHNVSASKVKPTSVCYFYGWRCVKLGALQRSRKAGAPRKHFKKNTRPARLGDGQAAEAGRLGGVVPCHRLPARGRRHAWVVAVEHQCGRRRRCGAAWLCRGLRRRRLRSGAGRPHALHILWRAGSCDRTVAERGSEAGMPTSLRASTAKALDALQPSEALGEGTARQAAARHSGLVSRRWSSDGGDDELWGSGPRRGRNPNSGRPTRGAEAWRRAERRRRARPGRVVAAVAHSILGGGDTSRRRRQRRHGIDDLGHRQKPFNGANCEIGGMMATAPLDLSFIRKSRILVCWVPRTLTISKAPVKSASQNDGSRAAAKLKKAFVLRSHLLEGEKAAEVVGD